MFRIGISAAAGVCAVAFAVNDDGPPGKGATATRSPMTMLVTGDPSAKECEKKEVVVVGGGVCGLSTAWTLARFGHKVTLFEREEIGAYSQASSINSGFLHTEPTTDPNGMEDWNSFSSRLSMAMYKYLDASGKVEYKDTGMMLAIQDEAQLRYSKSCYPTEPDEVTKNTSEILKDSPRVVSLQRAREIEPLLSTDLLGGVWWPKSAAATCHPRKATVALAEKAMSSGVAVIEGAEVSGLDGEEKGRGWRVSYRILKNRLDPGDASDERVVRADVVVLAAGAWCPYLGELAGGVSIPIIPVLGIMWSTPAQKTNQVEALIGSMESSYHWEDNPSEDQETPPRATHRGLWERGGRFSNRLTRHLYGKQTKDGRFIFGGDRIPHPEHRPGLIHSLPRLPGLPPGTGENQMRSENVTANKEHASEVLPLLRNLEIERTWAGIMPFSRDGKPIIGKLEESAAPLYVCTGLGGSGFCRGPASGILLGAFIHDGRSHAEVHKEQEGRAPFYLLRETDPNRFRQEEN